MKKFYNIMGCKINIQKKNQQLSYTTVNQLKTVMEKESCLKN